MIHLGELLTSEDKSQSQVSGNLRKEIHNYSDRQEILYLKALASESDPVAIQKQLADEKAKIIKEQNFRNPANRLIEEELKYSRINKMKLLSDWRVIMRIAKVDEVRKLIELYMQNFERELDNKDAILQMLDKDIEEAEEHYNIALNNHFIHLKQLTILQDSRVKGLFKEFAKDIDELDLEFTKEMEEIDENFKEEQNEINRMRLMIEKEYDAKIEEVKRELNEISGSQVQKINEVYNRIQENIKKSATSDNSKFSGEMLEIRQRAEDKNKTDRDNIFSLNELEKTIAFKKKKVDRHNEELKQWKIKIKQNNEDWEAKNEALKSEKQKIMDAYKLLKRKLIIFRNNQREKLKKLVKNSWEAVTKLKEYIKLAEKILKLAEICRRLETERVSIYFI
jgi:hypothetical protein